MRFASVTGLILVALLGGAPASGQGPPYYAGRTIEIIVPFSPGGGVDIQSRFMAPYFEKHLPGHPRVLVRNMPGGGGILGMNFFASSAKPDGTQMLALSSGASAIPYLLGAPAVRYDFRQWRLVATNGGGGVIYTAPRTGVRRAGDLRHPSEPLVYGGLSPIALDLNVLLLFELLGVPARAVFGFEGRGPVLLAFERGEVNIDHQTTAVYRSQVVRLVEEGKAIPLLSFGLLDGRGRVLRDPTAPELPTVYEVFQQMTGRKPDGLLRWKALQAVLVPSFTYNKTFWVPQATPAQAVNALWDAVARMSADPQFRAQGRAILEGYALTRGDRSEGAFLRSTRVTLDVQRFIKDLLRAKYSVDI